MNWGWLTNLVEAIAWIYLVSGVDDLAMDLLYWWRSRGGRFSHRMALGGGGRETGAGQPGPGETEGEKPFAIVIPAWKEAGIIGRMLQGNLRTIRYGRFKIFVGCYPNDPETVAEVQAVADPRVSCVVNRLPGPTSKGQVLNEVIHHVLRQPEGFAAVLMQDAEDIMHPVVLRGVNRALDSFDFVQTPVFSLPLSVGDWVACTYLDEFAEFHTKDQWLRSEMGAATPSAGVGTAVAVPMIRKVIGARGDFLRNDSLTEDYELGHFVNSLRGRSVFLREMLPQEPPPGVDSLRGRLFRQVATLEYFPKRFRAAVRQKARWMIGITLKGYGQIGWQGSLANRYFLYRDRKGMVMNLIGLVGMAALALVVAVTAASVLMGTTSPLQWRWGETSTHCFIANSVLAANRLLQRAAGVHRIYGDWRLTLSSPLRVPVSALINGLASTAAVWRYAKAKVLGLGLAWDKTQHELPSGFGGQEAIPDEEVKGTLEAGALVGQKPITA